MAPANLADPTASVLRSRWVARALFAALAWGWVLPTSAAEVCTAVADGTWGPVWGGSVVWSCPGGTPSGDDHFIVPAGVVVSIVDDVVQTAWAGAGVTVRAGGVLEAAVSDATGGITITLGPSGLVCQAGATCIFRGGYREIGVPSPEILTDFSEAAVFRVGDVVPCDGDDGEGPVADCHGAAATPGDATTVRFDYPAARYDPAAGGVGPPHPGAAFAALDATTDVVCFFLPQSMQDDPGYRSAELNQCYDVVAVGASDPRFLRLDATQSVRNQPGYPLARKRIHELELAAPVATAGRAISVPPETITADGQLAARWLAFQGEDGRPLGRPHRILRSLDGGAGNDLLVIGDLRGVGESHVAGERVWITYGFASGDPFAVLVPVRIGSATPNPSDTVLVTGDATLEMESVWLDGVKRVDARGDGQHRIERVWFRDPTPGQPGLDLDLHAFHLDHRDATNGRFVLRQVSVTGGDARGSVCGPAQNTPCLHDAVHWGKATDLLLEDVSARYVGKGCFPCHGGDKSSSGTTLVRLSCEFVVDGAIDGSLFAFDEGHETATIRDAFCGACGKDGTPIVWGVGAGGALAMEGVAIWGGRSAWFDMPQQNVVRDLFVAGTTAEFAPPTLPARVDGFVHRENTIDALAPSAELFGADAVEARNGVIRELSVRTLHLARPGPSLVLENLALLDPIALRPARSVLEFVSAPQGAVLRRVLLWFSPGSQPLWTSGVEIAADPMSLTLDGLLAVHARGDFGPVLELGASAVAATTFGAGPCFHDDHAAVQPGTEGLYPVTTVWDAGPGFVDEARGNLLPAPGGVAAAVGCGLDPVHPPGLRGKRFAHWLTKTSPELVGTDGDGDGIPEGGGAPPCGPGQSQGCRDVCLGAFDPAQADADGDGAGDACEAACRNGLDDDGDGLVDLADPGCSGAGDESEETLARCSNGLDDDADGLVDFGQDPGCGVPGDDLETSLALACDDGRDGDGDDLVDTADPGCPTGLAPREDPACDDRFDNDGDGSVDLDDPVCGPGAVQSESPRRGCGLGFEVAAALVALQRLRRERARASPSSVAAAVSALPTAPGSGAKVRSNT